MMMPNLNDETDTDNDLTLPNDIDKRIRSMEEYNIAEKVERILRDMGVDATVTKHSNVVNRQGVMKQHTHHKLAVKNASDTERKIMYKIAEIIDGSVMENNGAVEVVTFSKN